jgi:hypothetical protein
MVDRFGKLSSSPSSTLGLPILRAPRILEPIP